MVNLCPHLNWFIGSIWYSWLLSLFNTFSLVSRIIAWFFSHFCICLSVPCAAASVFLISTLWYSQSSLLRTPFHVFDKLIQSPVGKYHLCTDDTEIFISNLDLYTSEFQTLVSIAYLTFSSAKLNMYPKFTCWKLNSSLPPHPGLPTFLPDILWFHIQICPSANPYSNFTIYKKFDCLSPHPHLPPWSKSPAPLTWITATASWLDSPLPPLSLFSPFCKEPRGGGFLYNVSQINCLFCSKLSSASYPTQSKAWVLTMAYKVLPNLGPLHSLSKFIYLRCLPLSLFIYPLSFITLCIPP